MRSFFLTIVATLATPISRVLAADPAFPKPSQQGLPDLNGATLSGPRSVINFIDTMTNWFFVTLITISVIYILIAAYKYMSSNGESVESAHKMLMYAAVGIAVAVLAKGIVFAIRVLVDNSSRPISASSTHLHDHTA